jgi:hypothetical protein
MNGEQRTDHGCQITHHFYQIDSNFELLLSQKIVRLNMKNPERLKG